MKLIFFICILLLIQTSNSFDFNVKTNSELTKALASVNAGDNIYLADGKYIGIKFFLWL